jgi:hypothetical protein
MLWHNFWYKNCVSDQLVSFLSAIPGPNPWGVMKVTTPSPSKKAKIGQQFQHAQEWFLHAKSNFRTVWFYTQSVMSTHKSIMLTHESNFDAYAYKYDTHECDLYTFECGSYTLSVISTRSVISTSTNVIPRFQHAECDFTRKVWFVVDMTLTSVIKTRTTVISTRTRVTFTRRVWFWHV